MKTGKVSYDFLRLIYKLTARHFMSRYELACLLFFKHFLKSLLQIQKAFVESASWVLDH